MLAQTNKNVTYALVIVPTGAIKRPWYIFSGGWNLKLKTTPKENDRPCSTSNGHASRETRALHTGKPYLYPTYLPGMAGRRPTAQ